MPRGRSTRRRESIGRDIAPGLADGIVGGGVGSATGAGTMEATAAAGCSSLRRSPDRSEPNVTSMRTAAAAAAPPHHMVVRRPSAARSTRALASGTKRGDGSICQRQRHLPVEIPHQAQLLVEHPAARGAAVEMRRGLRCDLRAARVIDYRVRVSVTRHWSL